MKWIKLKDNTEGTITLLYKINKKLEKFKLNGTKRGDVKPGLRVLIVLKKDQRSGKLTEGIVKDVLTNSPNHPHGIKVRLKSGDIGRVQEIISAKQ